MVFQDGAAYAKPGAAPFEDSELADVVRVMHPSRQARTHLFVPSSEWTSTAKNYQKPQRCHHKTVRLWH